MFLICDDLLHWNGCEMDNKSWVSESENEFYQLRNVIAFGICIVSHNSFHGTNDE